MVWWMWAQGANPYQGLFATAAAHSAPASTPKMLEVFGSQACCMWSVAQGFYHFSQNWQRITKLNPAQCMEHALMAHMTDDSQREFDSLKADIHSHDPHDQAPCYQMCAQTEYGWLHLIFIPLGRGVFSVMVSDCTTQKSLEEQAHIAHRESQMALHSRSSFLSNMSHELRTPLNAILGFTQMLETPMNIAEQNRETYLAHIRESGMELLTKINDLIEISNIDAGCVTLREETLNLSDLMDAAIEMHSHAAFTRDITIRAHHAYPNMVLQADRAKLIKALSQLIGNAIKHSADGQNIIIGSHASTRDGIRISVEDKGCGIARPVLNNLHVALNAKQSYFNTDIDHIGLGLSITKEIIELHGGKLTIESSAKQGTHCIMVLPVARIVSLSARVRPKVTRRPRAVAA